jgi:hypothetical protein
MMLLLLFGMSQLPYNALHLHDDSDHLLAAHLGKDKNHHCELDGFYCQDGITHDCEHNSHIGKPIPQCFSCQFHFIKQLSLVQTELFRTKLYSCLLYAQITLTDSEKALSRAANKGPPAMIYSA